MKDFDFSKYKIKVFCVEKNEMEVINLMTQNGYEKIGETLANWIFVLKDWFGDKWTE